MRSAGFILHMSDHGPVVGKQAQKVWLSHLLSFTGMEHSTIHARTVHMAK